VEAASPPRFTTVTRGTTGRSGNVTTWIPATARSTPAGGCGVTTTSAVTALSARPRSTSFSSGSATAVKP
jgi:hypothetical protein